MNTVTPDLHDPQQLDEFVRLAFIAQQSRDSQRSLHARIATTAVTLGEAAARVEAYFEGGEFAAEVANRVITFLDAVRTKRTRYWQVEYVIQGKGFRSSKMHTGETARAQYEWAGRLPGAEQVTITECTDTLTYFPANVEVLPREQDRPAPDVPGAYQVHRFYKYDGEGPAVLPDGAAVRRAHAHLYDGRPRRYALAPRLLDVIRVVMTRPVDVDQVTPLR
ncbi:hypothetical protein QMK19_29065 [Streptomyces sp. H10-C2]|uniref:hypothetical protein n=1 Tax=Streptomyces TaxID=1883 RepID=UPI0018DFFA0F|nr:MULTISPECIES: hypothetical protein [Streptomyces]MDJ0344262.1 hypothetical protein [Streptomyces sp. PH10-H1]MDJ0373600.1 hypothetical protein [Streptomyces sp. H10-C2]